MKNHLTQVSSILIFQDKFFFKSRGHSNLRCYRDWGYFNCWRGNLLSIVLNLRTGKKATQEKFVFENKHGVRYQLVMVGAVSVPLYVYLRVDFPVRHRRCFGTIGCFLPLVCLTPSFTNLLNICSLYIFWKISRHLLATTVPNTLNKSIPHCRYIYLTSAFFLVQFSSKNSIQQNQVHLFLQYWFPSFCFFCLELSSLSRGIFSQLFSSH